MAQVISDERIAEMIAEPKLLPRDWRERLANLRPKMFNNEAAVDVLGAAGTQFTIIVRQHRQYRNNFSVILMIVTLAHPEFRLLRYDGGHHSHPNRIESTLIENRPHIHRATARYQNSRYPDDGYAVESQDYDDLAGAWILFSDEVKLELPEGIGDAALPEKLTEVKNADNQRH